MIDDLTNKTKAKKLFLSLPFLRLTEDEQTLLLKNQKEFDKFIGKALFSKDKDGDEEGLALPEELLRLWHLYCPEEWVYRYWSPDMGFCCWEPGDCFDVEIDMDVLKDIHEKTRQAYLSMLVVGDRVSLYNDMRLENIQSFISEGIEYRLLFGRSEDERGDTWELKTGGFWEIVIICDPVSQEMKEMVFNS